MQVYTSLQTDNHASTPPLSFFTGRMPFLPPNQQRQSTEGKNYKRKIKNKFNTYITQLYKQNWLQFLFVVKATALKRNIICNF